MEQFSAKVFAGVGYFVNLSRSGDFQIIFDIREEDKSEITQDN